MRATPQLSIIIPVYWNSDTLEVVYQEIRKTFDGELQENELEIVFIDDSSGDNSFEILCNLADRDRDRVRVLRLTRNFGSHPAILAGLKRCSGKYAAIIGADLQEHPDLVLRMLREAEAQNSEVILACRSAREESRVKVAYANTFYWIMRKFSDAKFPPGGFDAFLIERRVRESLVSLNEVNSSLAAQVLWTGYKTTSITYVKRERAAGTSRWNFSKKLRLTLDSIISFSRLPVRIMEIAGLVTALTGGCYALLIVYLRLFKGAPLPGWSSLMVVLLIVSGIGFLSLGIIGEYLWRILDAARRRPVYLVAEERNFDDSFSTRSVIRGSNLGLTDGGDGSESVITSKQKA